MDELTINDVLALIEGEIARYEAMEKQYSGASTLPALTLGLLKTKILEVKIARVESAAPAVPAPTTDAPFRTERPSCPRCSIDRGETRLMLFKGGAREVGNVVYYTWQCPSCNCSIDAPFQAPSQLTDQPVPAPRVPDALVTKRGKLSAANSHVCANVKRMYNKAIYSTFLAQANDKGVEFALDELLKRHVAEFARQSTREFLSQR